jgi:hypothetical protein
MDQCMLSDASIVEFVVLLQEKARQRACHASDNDNAARHRCTEHVKRRKSLSHPFLPDSFALLLQLSVVVVVLARAD